MVKIEEGQRRRLAAFRRRSEMASNWSNNSPVSKGALFRERRSINAPKKQFIGGATTLMYAAQQGDVEKVKKIVRHQVSRPSLTRVSMGHYSITTC